MIICEKGAKIIHEDKIHLLMWAAVTVGLLCAGPSSRAGPESGSKIPAFPGAQGFGAYALGGRGGRVYLVTTLADYIPGKEKPIPGSLRAAVEANRARIVLFRVSGNIELRQTLTIRNPYITIAGQTAPGAGICLKNYGINVAADHVIIRYIRSRPSDNEGIEQDSLSVSAGKNIIIDHCSTSWATDETLSVATSGQLDNVTVQWCMITESLNRSVHAKGGHGYGSLIRGGWGNKYTFHHNLYAHHRGRSPRPGNYNNHKKDPKGLIFDFRNNVIYNWGGSFAGYNADGSNKADSITKMNFVGNYYKRGPNSTGNSAFWESSTYSIAYFSGNCMNGNYPPDPWSLVAFGDFSQAQKDAYKRSSPIKVAPVNTDDAKTAYQHVLADAGATLPVRDAVDVRITNHVKKQIGRIINDEDEVGSWPELKSTAAPKDSDTDGMPDEWEKKYGLNVNDASDNKKDMDGDGYTNIEEYINNTDPTEPEICRAKKSEYNQNQGSLNKEKYRWQKDLINTS